MSLFRKRVRHREEFSFVNTSGVDDFSFEAEHKDINLFVFSCDEEDGPITVFFNANLKDYEIDLTALRTLLDDVEAELLERRRGFQELRRHYEAP